MLYDYANEDTNSIDMENFLRSLDKDQISENFEKCFGDLKISKLKDVAEETEKNWNSKC